MKKFSILLVVLFLSLFFTPVEAISFDKANEISWDFEDNSEDTNSDTLKVEDGYIYTELSSLENNIGIKIIKRNNKGTIIWSNFISAPCPHNITLLGNNVYYTNACYGTVKIDAKTGNTIKENTDVIGKDIKEINGNLVILEEEQLTIINQELEVLYKIESSKINTSYTDIMYLDYYVEDNQIYALVYIDDNNTNYIVTLNEKLEIEKNIEITYDDNQGHLSEHGFFEEYNAFVKLGNDFYQIGWEIYKISSSGKATLILEETENDYCQHRYAVDAIVVDGHLVTLEEIWDDCEDVSHERFSIYDNDFKEISSVKISSLEEKPYAWGRSLTKTNDGFIIRWFDEFDSYNSNITEYSINTPSCKVISGTGKNIGDEIQCGTENFYVLSNDGKQVKMLAKYNLYAGLDYYKIEFDQTFSTYNDAVNYYNNNYASQYTDYEKFLSKDNEYYGVIAYKEVKTDKILQNKIAIGAHGNLKVEPEFPELGVYPYYWENWQKYIVKTVEDEYSLGYRDVLIDSYSTAPADWLYVLENYEKELVKQNITSENVSLLSVNELNELVLKVTGKELPLETWYNNKDNWGKANSAISNNNSYIVGSIKDLMPKGYEWLWLTTYWTRTTDPNNELVLYFVDTMGDLCSGDYCDDAVGAGLRPVITMSVEELEYKIETKTDNKGTIEVKPSSGTGEKVQVTITPKKGYELKEVRVTDAEGNVLTFTNYTFIMPSSNVTIEAIFEVKNPNTAATSIIVFILIGIYAIFVMRKSKKRIQWLTN